ncbi:MAG: T9SS type A sorting domain-containing protein [Bacteroidales bacterium]|nr:T9SS type A sorting domain-containing protein [Bacteroidales bacterium]
MKKIATSIIILISVILSLQGQAWIQTDETYPEDYIFHLADEFGFSIDVSGDYAVIGAPGTNEKSDRAYAYVFHISGGEWQLTAKLTTSLEVDARFGASVGISGDVIIVGAYLDNKVYVYEKPDEGWEDMTETAILNRGGGNPDDYFGQALSIEGNTIVVGAVNKDNDFTDAGMAFVFVKPSGGWINMSPTAKLTPSDRFTRDYFGAAVDISNDCVVVGMPKGKDTVYVFMKPSAGWSDMNETAKIAAPEGSSVGEFGHKVGIIGETIAIGDYTENKVYLYQKSGTYWTNVDYLGVLTPSDGESGDKFGFTLDMNDEYIVVGSIGSASHSNDAGTAYVYKKPAEGWDDATENARLMAANGLLSDGFARAVAIHDSGILSGAYQANSISAGSGQAYFFPKLGDSYGNMEMEPGIYPPEYHSNSEDSYGCSVAIDGDYAVVGARGHNDHKGCAYVYKYEDGLWNSIARLSTSNKGDAFGCSVAILDTTIVIGACSHYVDNYMSGAAYVFTMPPGGWKDTTETAILYSSDGDHNDGFGSSVAIDTNVIVVGAPTTQNELGYWWGTAYVFEKPEMGWVSATETARLIPDDQIIQQQFGQSIAIRDDCIVIGAFRDMNETGSAYVFTKPAEGWTDTSQTAKLTASDGAENDHIGWSVDLYGDYIVVGTYGWNDNGAAYIFKKPVGDWEDMTEVAKLSPRSGERKYFGSSVSIYKNILAVGAMGAGDREGGIICMFEAPEMGWTDANSIFSIQPTDTRSVDRFGCSVDLWEERLVAGLSDSDDVAENAGAVKFFERTFLEALGENFDSERHAYPNPTDGIVYIPVEDGSLQMVQVFNLKGEVVFREACHSLKNYFDLRNLPKGLYILEWITKASTSRSEIVIY